LRDTLLFLLDEQRGVFVYSLADTLNSRVLTFFKIPAVTDFIISGNIMYADSWRDLVVIDISDLYQIRETNRVRDVVTPRFIRPTTSVSLNVWMSQKALLLDGKMPTSKMSDVPLFK
jgi:hypothetical protein